MSGAGEVAATGVDEAAALDLLAHGEIEVRARIAEASNATLLARVSRDGSRAACVYKPTTGERPLWDFPSRTLARREVAAYLISAATGWGLVPPTVLREGPLGRGSVQLWVEDGRVDGDGDPVLPEAGAGLVDVIPPQRVPAGWLTVIEAEDYDGSPVVLAHADAAVLRRMAVFDVVVNNADRKGGHVLRAASGTVFGVDHGLTFNVEDKLRTVLWGWAGQALPAEACETLSALVDALAPAGSLRQRLRGLLSADEVDRTRERARSLLGAGRHPRPPRGRPAIPWPAF